MTVKATDDTNCAVEAAARQVAVASGQVDTSMHCQTTDCHGAIHQLPPGCRPVCTVLGLQHSLCRPQAKEEATCTAATEAKAIAPTATPCHHHHDIICMSCTLTYPLTTNRYGVHMNSDYL